MSNYDDPFDAPRNNSASGKNDVGGVHQSLWSNLQLQGYGGSPASSIAWMMIRATRPHMNRHRESVDSLARRPVNDIQQLLQAAEKTLNSKTTADSKGRRELAGLIVRHLKGLVRAYVDREMAKRNLNVAPPSGHTVTSQSGVAPAIPGTVESAPRPGLVAPQPSDCVRADPSFPGPDRHGNMSEEVWNAQLAWLPVWEREHPGATIDDAGDACRWFRGEG